MGLGVDASRQDTDGVADARGSVHRDDGACRTTAAGQQGLELEDVGHAEHLADVGARLGLTVDSQGDAAGPDLSVRREKAHAGKALDRDLLAQVAGLKIQRSVCRAVDDHDGALDALRVRVALDAAADTAGHLAHGARAFAAALVKVQRDDPGVHTSRRTVIAEPLRAISLKPAWTYIDSGPW